MKKIISLVLVCSFALSNRGMAQESKSMLWEISGNGLPASSYIQGTMHLMCEKDFEVKQKTWDVLDKVQKLVLELDYSSASEMEAMTQMLQSDKKLTELLSKSQHKELKTILVGYGVTLEEVDSFTPQALYTLIGKKATPCPQSEVKMFEVELLVKAVRSQKSIGGLEGVADQVAALSHSYNMKEILRQLKAGDEYALLAQKMIKAFKDEHISELDALLKDRRFMSLEQEHFMLDKRNEKWVNDVMPSMMQGESVLFAVGGGHLWGKKGVLQLLKLKGYTITPVL